MLKKNNSFIPVSSCTKNIERPMNENTYKTNVPTNVLEQKVSMPCGPADDCTDQQHTEYKTDKTTKYESSSRENKPYVL